MSVPDNATLASFHMFLSCSHAKILIVAAGLLDPRIKNNEIVDDLEQSLLAAKLTQFLQQRIIASVRVRPSFLPTQPVLLRRLNHAIAQTFGFIASHHELHRRIKRTNKRLFLAIEILADTLGHRDRRTL